MANTRHQSLGLGMSRKRTRKRVFLEEMDRVVPWRELVEFGAAYRINAGRGRPPVTVEVMLRIHFMRHWVKLSDPVMEEAFHNMAASAFGIIQPVGDGF